MQRDLHYAQQAEAKQLELIQPSPVYAGSVG